MAMDDSGTMRVLIGSAGRRVYLIRWFEDAFARLGITGEVHVTDADPRAAAYSAADHAHVVPPYSSSKYRSAMVTLVERIRPSLFFSVNDYELEILATSGLSEELESLGVPVLSLAGSLHSCVHDKLRMHDALIEIGVSTPATVLLSDRAGVAALADKHDEIVIKDRFGSGSSGLQRVDSSRWELAAAWLTSGSTPADHFVVQPTIKGTEFGIDIVAPIVSGAHDTAVLARKKIRMRAGETDQAKSADAGPFNDIARRIASWTQHRGSIDVDVLLDEDGVGHVIDINPRFGGGYPFSHLAGADLPSLYVAQLISAEFRPEDFLTCSPGIVSSKYEAVLRVAPAELEEI
ncbi:MULTISPECIES: ATP-grasp domain-containing protein [unclassified Microbacterium]|uniref:ATP-grasp domain-containing protein n=1 Tax=unclassified Microbacterium TaxID=2609290 RepID=UPI0012FA6886|nr:ATP-grasp domain-containing protein [Microbacterium sp. MAH-37]MVQ42660.1 ATP-grasp domain-containing protein [Microbacterium sp. MAH-37]